MSEVHAEPPVGTLVLGKGKTYWEHMKPKTDQPWYLFGSQCRGPQVYASWQHLVENFSPLIVLQVRDTGRNQRPIGG